MQFYYVVFSVATPGMFLKVFLVGIDSGFEFKGGSKQKGQFHTKVI